MGKYHGKTHDEILALVTAGGVVDYETVEELNDFIYTNNDVEQAEFNLVVAIDNALQQNGDNSEMWPELYREVITDYVLSTNVGADSFFYNEDTRIEMSEEDAAELIATWNHDGILSVCERAAAKHIRFLLGAELPVMLENFLMAHGVY